MDHILSIIRSIQLPAIVVLAVKIYLFACGVYCVVKLVPRMGSALRQKHHWLFNIIMYTIFAIAVLLVAVVLVK